MFEVKKSKLVFWVALCEDGDLYFIQRSGRSQNITYHAKILFIEAVSDKVVVVGRQEASYIPLSLIHLTSVNGGDVLVTSTDSNCDPVLIRKDEIHPMAYTNIGVENVDRCLSLLYTT